MIITILGRTLLGFNLTYLIHNGKGFDNKRISRTFDAEPDKLKEVSINYLALVKRAAIAVNIKPRAVVKSFNRVFFPACPARQRRRELRL